MVRRIENKAMDSYESKNMLSSSSPSSFMQEEDVTYDHDHDSDDGFDRLHQGHNLSRLSVYTSSMYTNEGDQEEVDDDDDDVSFDSYGEHGLGMSMSGYSIESFDTHEELSDFEKRGKINTLELSSDTDKEPGCYSPPATPPRRRNRGGFGNPRLMAGVNKSTNKEELEGYEGMGQDSDYSSCGYCNGGSGENEGGGGGVGGVVVITRPKGGKRALCMDLDEVKACMDLGLELENEGMLEMPGCVSLSGGGSTLVDATSSGGNSPIASWRIFSPGDDPRDVKARLKVWAQAVALASACWHRGV